MKITVDRGGCITSGQCVLVAPEVFDQDDEGMVVLLQDNPAATLDDAVRRAAKLCPAGIIHLHE